MSKADVIEIEGKVVEKLPNAFFNVEYGYYTVAVHYQSVSGIIFSGRLESLSLLPEQGEEVMKVQLQLARSKINALVIKEIYYVGCKGELGADYQADQYVTLYNNSDETVYLEECARASEEVIKQYPNVHPKYDELFNSETLDGVTGILLYKAYETRFLCI